MSDRSRRAGRGTSASRRRSLREPAYVEHLERSEGSPRPLTPPPSERWRELIRFPRPRLNVQVIVVGLLFWGLFWIGRLQGYW